MLKKEHIVQNY